MKHTPGPWEADVIGNTEPDGTGWDLCDIQTKDGLTIVAFSVEQRNVPLIAAAPELLEALKRIASISDGELSGVACAEIASTAIAKAEGK